MQHLPETGLGNPVTAVLIAYRAFDTMLEKVVLVLAVVGVWSLAADRYWGGAPGEARAERPEPTLAFLAQVLAPLGILVGVHVFWVGADEPGGAFQGGAILAAMWMIVMMARLTEAPQTSAFWLRLALVAGPLVFLAAGVAGAIFAGGFFAYPPGLRQAGDPVHRGVHGPLHRRDASHAGGGSAATRAATMTSATLAGLVGAALVGLGLYGLIANPQPLRKILAFNLMGSGVFLVFGIVARKGAAAGLQADPVPQAMVITGIVVAFAASALAVALVLRLFEETGQATLNPDAWAKPPDDGAERRMTAGASAIAATAGGSLLPLAILLPALGVLLSLLLGGRRAEWIALGLMPVEFAVAVAIACLVWRSGQPLVYTLAGYAPPLGIALRADGFSAVMLVTAGLIAPAAALYARTNFATPQERRKSARRSSSGPCCRASRRR